MAEREWKTSRIRIRHSLGQIILLLAAIEVTSVTALFVANRWLGFDLMSRQSILASQDARIDSLLAGREALWTLDPTLGWTLRPGVVHEDDTVSGQGLRGAQSYSGSAPEGERRIAAFGDSFVYCSEVPSFECWTSRLERQWRAEVPNFGVSGYGTDQAFLRYLTAPDSLVHSATILIGFAPVNIRRNVNRYRRFLDPREELLFKPRFVLESSGRLSLIPAPVGGEEDLRDFRGDLSRLQQAGRDDDWYHRVIYANPLIDGSAFVRLASWSWVELYRWLFDPGRRSLDGTIQPTSHRFDLQLALLRAFADSASARGARPVHLLLPNRTSVLRYRDGQPTLYRHVADSLSGGDALVVDLVDALAGYAGPVDDLYMPRGHYSPVANRLVTEEVARRLALEPR